ncbi:MAG: glycosyltransferase family 4 protein [Planctomycetes bacterium]|nr:glycosyltransferase family 4 protein [Planctomycetota bacterium]
MKIALVIYHYSDSKGGVERYVSDLSKGLIKLRNEVHIFCHTIDVPVPKEIIFHQVPISGKFYSPLKLASFAENSARLLKKEKFDVIQGFGRTYYQDILRFGSGIHWEYLKQRHPSMANPIGRFIQLINPHNRAIMHLERKSLLPGNYKKVICISNLVKREIQRYYNVPEYDITVIYNGIDPERFTPDNRTKYRDSIRKELNITEKDLMALFVGSGFERKGLRYAIEGIARVDKEIPIKLVVIGNGATGKYKFLADIKGIGDKVIFAGTKSNIEQYYAASDIFIFPSLYDAFGTAVLEAMASGLPSLVSNQSGASEVVFHGTDSFIINPHKTDELTKYLTDLSNPARRENIGNAARQTALKYSFVNNLNSTLEVYKKIT